MALIYDIEVCPDAWLIAFKNTATGAYFWVWSYDGTEGVRQLGDLARCGDTFVGFNNHGFDDPLYAAMVMGRTPQQIKRMGDDIIEKRLWPWRTYKMFELEHLGFDSVDLMQVAPSFVGLKAYGARMHMPKLQDLPFDHTKCWEDEDLDMVLKYCLNDLDTTEALWEELEGPLAIRSAMGREYHIDMRSLSDTQMAERGFIKRLDLRYGQVKVPKTIEYVAPKYLDAIEDAQLIELHTLMTEKVFAVKRDTGHVVMPPDLSKARKMLGGIYRTGVGGLHSQHDRKICFVGDEDYTLWEIDAAAFYPSIMINSNTGGKAFIDEYRKIYDQRMIAKKTGDKVADATLKISLNGTFGKTAAMHSPLYDPAIMLHITLTGQLVLLALIERVIERGGDVVSANTDGIVVGLPKEVFAAVEAAVEAFEELTGFVFEWTQYRAVAFKDVNNYFAVKDDRSVKRRGIYAPLSLRKNPSASVCANAVGEWLAHGTPFEETIESAEFVDFLSARNVTGGAEQGGLVLGKVVRWYMSIESGLDPILYVKNGNKVPKTDGGLACMDLPEKMPWDVDFGWYYDECVRIVKDIGCERFLITGEK